MLEETGGQYFRDVARSRNANFHITLRLANASIRPISNMKPSELDHAEAHSLCDRVGAADGLELVDK